MTTNKRNQDGTGQVSTHNILFYTGVAYYNFNAHQPISVIFGGYVADGVW